MHANNTKKIIVMNIVLDVLRYLSEHNITLVKAAEATGVAQQNIKKSIGNNPKASTLLALAKGLGVDPREFFYDLDEKEEKEAVAEKNDTTTDVQSSDASSPDVGLKTYGVQLPDEQPIINTTAFCPHCGAKVRVGVVLLPE